LTAGRLHCNRKIQLTSSQFQLKPISTKTVIGHRSSVNEKASTKILGQY
jgi:hypothetical protein